MSGRSRESSLEWEPVAEPIEIKGCVIPSPPFVGGAQKLVIYRDHGLQLRVTAEGSVQDTGELARRFQASQRTVPGTFLPSEEFTVEGDGSRLTVKAIVNDFPETSFFANDPSRRPFRQSGRVDHLRQKRTKRFVVEAGEMQAEQEPMGPPMRRSDWFINGPHSDLYRRWTKRRWRSTFHLSRESVERGVIEPGNERGTFDHLIVQAEGVRFTISKVPPGLAPEWCYPISIEHEPPFPDCETGEALGEIISFVVGRRLMRLGATVFDDLGWPVEQEAVNPIGRGVRDLCAQADRAPVPLDEHSTDAETILARLVPTYLKLRSELCLKEALLGYWVACESPGPLNLPLFASAVEALKHAWFRSSKTKSKGVYMAKDEFVPLVQDLVDSLRERLEERDGTEAILSKIMGAYNMGPNEQLRKFFEEIGLDLGRAEQEAIKARNRSAHGNILSEGDVNTQVQISHAYRTLFERTFLRVLGYDGTYIDKTTLGYPPRSLAVPTGGAH